jgi:hypothetical protein
LTKSMELSDKGNTKPADEISKKMRKRYAIWSWNFKISGNSVW